MKDCNKVKRLLSSYLDKEISPNDNFFIEEHLKVCSGCRKELQELLKVKELILGSERKNLPDDYLVYRLRERIKSEDERRKKVTLSGMGNLSRKLIPVPAATILISVIFLFLVSQNSQLNEFSLEDNMLSGAPVTKEAALGLILGVWD